MRVLKFTKMVGAGNDFIVLDSRVKDFHAMARKLCNRKTGVGADGVLVLQKSKKADFKMRIFNADGSEAEMCGNGLRCAVLYTQVHKCTSAQVHKKKIKIETLSGIYEAEITGKDKVKIKMQGPKDLRLNFPIEINGRKLCVNYINTGVPHTVVFVDGLEKINVDAIGANIRYHEEFKPEGTNVDFVQIVDDKNIKMRTYERGVEGETLACGTGAVASAIITCHVSRVTCHGINVHTRGGILRVGFSKIGNKIKDVYLEGEAKIVFEGNIII